MSEKNFGSHILPERMERFTSHLEDLIFFNSEEEKIEYNRKHHAQVIWYGERTTGLYGAIIGDIVGSRFEGRGKQIKTKDFELFAPDSRFTDDTVMTVAIADGLLHCLHYYRDFDNIPGAFAVAMKRWGQKYPHAGYGKKFSEWIFSKHPQPYNSFGNGAAMKVSAIAWSYDLLWHVELATDYITALTHNHPEGIKGAQAVASAIFLARKCSTKEKIKNYIEKNFEYDLSRSLDDIRQTYQFEISCQKTVPEAIIAFLESTDFGDAIRNAVSLGGDSDTLAAITGSIAEAYYGVPEKLIKKCKKYLPKDILEVVDKFHVEMKKFI